MGTLVVYIQSGCALLCSDIAYCENLLDVDHVQAFHKKSVSLHSQLYLRCQANPGRIQPMEVNTDQHAYYNYHMQVNTGYNTD